MAKTIVMNVRVPEEFRGLVDVVTRTLDKSFSDVVREGFLGVVCYHVEQAVALGIVTPAETSKIAKREQGGGLAGTCKYLAEVFELLDSRGYWRKSLDDRLLTIAAQRVHAGKLTREEIENDLLNSAMRAMHEMLDSETDKSIVEALNPHRDNGPAFIEALGRLPETTREPYMRVLNDFVRTGETLLGRIDAKLVMA